MSFFEIVGLSIVGFICVYALVDRICTCVERKYVANAYTETTAGKANKEEVQAGECGETK